MGGGLETWREAGLPTEPLSAAAASIAWKEVALDDLLRPVESSARSESLFLPRIAGQTFLEGRTLPLKQEMVTLFVDMVGSTRLVFEQPPEAVLELMQAFMEIVIDIAAYHCGDVHDFEGDGALLYFEGAGEAVPAAFSLRDALLQRQLELPELPLPRLSMDAGPIVIGIVGTRFRQTVSLVGPSIHVAARILKLAPPGGIAVTDTILEHAKSTNPELAASFARLGKVPEHLRRELGNLRIWISAPPPPAG